MSRAPASSVLLLLSLLLVAATSAGAAEKRGGSGILASGDVIELVDPATGDARRLTTRGTGPAYVPSRHAFAYIREGGCAADGSGGCFTQYSVFVKSLANRSPKDPGRRVFGWREFFVRKVDVSPGGRMVFSAKPGPGPDGDRLDIYSSDLKGDRVRRLTRSPSFENDPAVSPDGRRVAFVRRVHGRGQIFVMSIDGGGPRQLTHNGRRNRLPAWSPDGRRLVFISQGAPGGGRYARRDIRTVTTTGAERIVTGFGRRDVVLCPAFSPDGGRIAFIWNNGLWLMSATGRNKRLLRRPPGYGGYEGGIDWAH